MFRVPIWTFSGVHIFASIPLNSRYFFICMKVYDFLVWMLSKMFLYWLATYYNIFIMLSTDLMWGVCMCMCLCLCLCVCVYVCIGVCECTLTTVWVLSSENSLWESVSPPTLWMPGLGWQRLAYPWAISLCDAVIYLASNNQDIKPDPTSWRPGPPRLYAEVKVNICVERS